MAKKPRGDYEVGKGRQPKHSRFKPGQSGNPKGRPKHAKNAKTILKQINEEPVAVRHGGRRRYMPNFEALARKLNLGAHNGDPKALASFLLLLRTFGVAGDDEGQVDPLGGLDDLSVIKDFLRRHRDENR